MAKSVSDVLTIMRKVIGQRDASAPDATDDILLGYLNDFIQLNFPQDVKLFDEWAWYEFDTVVDQVEYTFNGSEAKAINNIDFVTLRGPVYTDEFEGCLFLSPELFYRKWTYYTAIADIDDGQPADVLLYNDILTLRPKPDAVYRITIKGYPVNATLSSASDIPHDYWYRYLAYGAARDYLRDFMDVETLAQIEPAYQEYRELVLDYTASQTLTQVTVPRF